MLSAESERRHKISVHVMPPEMPQSAEMPDMGTVPNSVNTNPAPQEKEVGNKRQVSCFDIKPLIASGNRHKIITVVIVFVPGLIIKIMTTVIIL